MEERVSDVYEGLKDQGRGKRGVKVVKRRVVTCVDRQRR